MKIEENNVNHLESFIRLNEEWISKCFTLEKTDKDLASNPAKIIDDNGYIFSLVHNDEVMGVCALFNEGKGVFELARMAVSPVHQGKGYGKTLLKACLSKAQVINAQRVYLISNTRLESAVALYKKFGFVITQSGEHPLYSRANIVMELDKTLYNNQVHT